MATVKFIDSEDYEIRLGQNVARFKEVATAAIRAGAAVVAPVMRKNLSGVLSPDATGELVGALGITPVNQSANYMYNAHIGFDGYQETGWSRVPFQLLARVIESGIPDLRPAKPFAKPALRECREQIIDAMNAAAEQKFQEIMEGK